MDKDEVIDQIIQEVAEAAPHITSGMLHRREYVGEENPSDERQLEADVWANELLKELITSIEGVGQFASEEEAEITECGDGLSVAIDPLDGSSNIPTNNLVGTIVSVYDEKLPCRGENLVTAFYVLYGPLTTFTVARNGQVDEYVLEEKPGDKVKLQKVSENIQVPDAKIYGFGGNKNWTEEFRELESEVSQDYKLRYGGSLVGDFNQMLHHGGMFAYPERTDAPNGKYRLIFEGNPMAYIVETAGGRSSDGEKSVLQVEANEIHQRVPFHAGTQKAVDLIENNL